MILNVKFCYKIGHILAVHSPNGTNSESDRKAIQDEINQLTTEIDRVSETTKFNETYLLKGDDKANGNKRTFAAGDVLGEVDGLTVKAYGATVAELSDGDEVKLGTVTLKSSDTSKFTIADQAKAKDVVSVTSDGTNTTVTFKDGTTDTKAKGDIETNYGIETVGAGTANVSKELTLESTDATIAGTYKGSIDALDPDTVVKAKISIGSAGESALSTSGTKALMFSLHVGADSANENKISVKIDSMSSQGIGVDGLDVSTEASATKAIDTISSAIAKVSSQRSALGAIQNRLEHTIANLDNVVENTTAAESRIRDTDMAKEMVNYSKNNILAQAGQSMLAQANQSNQGVLSLLQ